MLSPQNPPENEPGPTPDRELSADLTIRATLVEAIGFDEPFDLIEVGATKTELENKVIRYDATRKYYGTLKGFDTLDDHLRGTLQDMQELEQSWGIATDALDHWEKRALLQYRLKFDESMLQLLGRIAEEYPPLDTDSPGSIVSVYGLVSFYGFSGSGKSLLAEGLRERDGEQVVVIDSDQARYNLLAKLVKESDHIEGEAHDSARNIIFASGTSMVFYRLIGFLSNVLKERGYTVARISTQFDQKADRNFYVEHHKLPFRRWITSMFHRTWLPLEKSTREILKTPHFGSSSTQHASLQRLLMDGLKDGTTFRGSQRRKSCGSIRCSR
jgi:hypothetical protein